MKSKTFTFGILVMLLTGFTALLYQVLWIRAFSSILGGNLLSISCVIAHFMLGLGLGNILAPGLLKRPFKKPWPLYSICEILIVLLAGTSLGILFFKSAWPLELLKWMSLPRLLEHFLLTGIFILPATLLMGFSFPLISYLFPHSKEHQWLYAANCIGGALGAFCSYSVLIYNFGLYGTLGISLCGNAFAALIFCNAFYKAPNEVVSKAKTRTLHTDFAYFFALGLSGISGFFILSFEQVWFRLASFVLGGKVYVHTLALTSILLCLGLAAWISPYFSKKDERTQIKVILITLLTALFSGAIGLLLLPQALDVTINFDAPSKKSLHDIFFVVLFFTAFLPSLVLGISFPLAFSLIQKKSQTAWQKTQALSRALYVNTAMSVLGSLITTYFLFNLFGTVGTLKALYGILALMGLPICFYVFNQRGAILSFGLFIVGLGLLFQNGPSLNTQQAAFYESEDEYGYLSLATLKDDKLSIMFHNYTSLVGAYGLSQTSAVQKNLALYALLLAPTTEDVLVVGMGYNLTAEAFLKVPEVKKVTSIELLPSVIKAQRHMKFKDNSALNDPRALNIADDGRSYIFQADKKWDIISVNVDPYGQGATALYSVEFYQEILRKLKSGGIYTQLIFGSMRDLPHMITTAQKVFPYLILMPGYDFDGFILVASDKAIPKWDSSEITSHYDRVKSLLPSATWDQALLAKPADFTAAEMVGLEAKDMVMEKPGRLIYDQNLLVETSRTSFWDLLLHYPSDYF